MPIICSDFECLHCKKVSEHFVSPGDTPKCPECGMMTKKIFSFGRVNMINESPEWLKSVVDVADHSSNATHVKEFIKNPTRDTYKKWMKGEGIRPMDYTENGGPPQYKPREIDTKKLKEAVAKKYFERKRIILQ